MTPGSFWILLAVSLAALICVFIFFKKDTEIMLSGVILSVSAIVFMINSVVAGGLLGISRNLILHQEAFDLMIIVIILCAVNMALEKRQELKEKFGVNQ